MPDFDALRQKLIELNDRWQKGLEMDKVGKFQTQAQHDRAVERFTKISREANEIWKILETDVPEMLKGVYLLEPVLEATDPTPWPEKACSLGWPESRLDQLRDSLEPDFEVNIVERGYIQLIRQDAGGGITGKLFCLEAKKDMLNV